MNVIEQLPEEKKENLRELYETLQKKVKDFRGVQL